MKRKHLWLMAMLLTVFLQGGVLYAEDMRDTRIKARQVKDELLKKALAEKKAAAQADAESRARILQDRTILKNAVSDLEMQNASSIRNIEHYKAESIELHEKEKDLSQQLSDMDVIIRELVGVIRVNAKDIAALIEQNPQSALHDNPDDFIKSMAAENQFPGMEDIRGMAEILMAEIQSAGEVFLERGTIVDRTGREVEADILMLGTFTAAYRMGEEVGFLNYSPSGKNLFALSRLPTRSMKKQISAYMDGESDAVCIDVSRGGALRQFVHKLSVWEQIPKGGPIVWPIMVILALGVVIILERTIFFLRKRFNADKLIDRISDLAVHEKWEDCRKLCERKKNKPVACVVAAGLDNRGMSREETENVLQEAILKEAPSTERFLSTLGMLAAIAPLLGLLGTVTGMIDTFHVITQHGTGDPRMMSGGISEALVTTMLGLSVAIPLLLAHTLFSRAADNLIGQMEEKGVALINIVHRSRDGS